MHQAHRQVPDTDPDEARGLRLARCAPGRSLDPYLDDLAVGVIDVRRARHARVEGVQGAEDLQRAVGSTTGVPTRAASYAPGFPFSSRGLAFQVAGHDGLVVADVPVLDDDPVGQ